MRLDSDRFCDHIQCHRFRYWYNLGICICCLIFAISACENTASGYAANTLPASPGAIDSATAPIEQTSGNSGNSTAPGIAALAVDSANLSFGDVTVGSKAILQVTVTSTGTVPLTIYSATIQGAEFSVPGSTFPLTLNPQQKTILNVQSAALTTGEASGTLILNTDSPANPSTVIRLAATGVARENPQLLVTPTSLSFGNITVGSTATLPVTITSAGTAPLTISSAEIAGTGFALSGVTFPVTLDPQQKLQLNIISRPQTPGAAMGSLAIVSNALRHQRRTISLTSTGVAQANPQLAIIPASLDFGNVTIGSAATLPVTLISTGTAPLTINSQAIVGAGFTITGAAFPITLQPHQSVVLRITFAPSAAKRAAGTLTISSNAERHTAMAVSLISNGIPQTNPQLTLSSTSLDFGTINDGSSATLPVTLTSSGTTPLTINSASVGGAGFTVSGAAFPVTLNPTMGITLLVQFKPAAGIPAAGALTINTDASANPAVVSLSGSGQYVVDLSWDGPDRSPDPVVGYQIYRSTKDSSSYELVNPSPDTLTTYVDAAVQSGTIYSYYVKSVDRSGAESSPSNVASVVVP